MEPYIFVALLIVGGTAGCPCSTVGKAFEDNHFPALVYAESNEEQRPVQAVSPPEERRRSANEDYFYQLKDGIWKLDNSPSSPQRYGSPVLENNQNQPSPPTQPIQNSSPYGSSDLTTSREHPLVEDEQHERPEPPLAEKADNSSPSDYTSQILNKPPSLQKEQKYPPVYDTHYAPQPYEYPRVESVYSEKSEEYNTPPLPNEVTPVYGLATPIYVPELPLANRRLRFEYVPRVEIHHPQELYGPQWVYLGSDQEVEYVPRFVKLQVNSQPQKIYHRPQVVKDHGEIYDYTLTENNETKNKNSPNENAATEYESSHEGNVQGDSQKKDESQSEENSSEKPVQVSGDQNHPGPAPRFYFKARVYVNGKH